MFNARNISYFLFLTSYLLASCSVQKQIDRSAKADVLSTKALEAAHVGISIYDPATGKYLYNYQGDHYFVPASNTKIPTCYAAMKYLGDSLVGLRYNVTTDSILLFKGTGDPTFLLKEFSYQPVYSFLLRHPYRLEVYPSDFETTALGNGWAWNDYMASYMPERSSFPLYGNLVTFYYKNGKVLSIPWILGVHLDEVATPYNPWTIVRPKETNNFKLIGAHGRKDTMTIPFATGTNKSSTNDLINTILTDTLKRRVFPYSSRTNTVWKTIHSQPTDSVLKPMMHRSDNFFAEQMLLMVSNEKLGVMNDEAIIDTLLKTDFKNLPQKPRWADGSGLSRYNLFTPQDMVMILKKMKDEFGMERIKVIFPTGGEGTISSYYKNEAGFIYGKTGTLSGVVAFSGFLYTKKGKLLIFSTLVNNHNESATEVRRAVEKFLVGVREKF